MRQGCCWTLTARMISTCQSGTSRALVMAREEGGRAKTRPPTLSAIASSMPTNLGSSNSSASPCLLVPSSKSSQKVTGSRRGTPGTTSARTKGQSPIPTLMLASTWTLWPRRWLGAGCPRRGAGSGCPISRRRWTFRPTMTAPTAMTTQRPPRASPTQPPTLLGSGCPRFARTSGRQRPCRMRRKRAGTSRATTRARAGRRTGLSLPCPRRRATSPSSGCRRCAPTTRRPSAASRASATTTPPTRRATAASRARLAPRQRRSPRCG
mmetsp:Transcript_53686/g.109423  ORF Transcript_53686/g.109423 Transcript_53686/m.109423 type:complete len:266 (-) Transcript_53686:358-1155(-)